MTTALDIPCKRPKVAIEHHPSVPDGKIARCHVPGCDWQYPGDPQYVAFISDAQQHATWHRSAHRAAVPTVDGHTCECGWQPTPGTVTKTDRDVSLTYHLTTVHGLVSC